MAVRASTNIGRDTEVLERDRRNGQRARLEWKGRFRVLDPSAPSSWVPCYLLDISSDGCAMEVHGELPELGQLVLVRLDADPRHHAGGLQLRARVANHRGPDDERVFGLEFRGLIGPQYEELLRITMTARRNPPRH